MKYPFEALSPSDPTGKGLGFLTKDRAERHAEMMNIMLETFESDNTWNMVFWKTKPEPWVVRETLK